MRYIRSENYFNFIGYHEFGRRVREPRYHSKKKKALADEGDTRIVQSAVQYTSILYSCYIVVPTLSKTSTTYMYKRRITSARRLFFSSPEKLKVRL